MNTAAEFVVVARNITNQTIVILFITEKDIRKDELWYDSYGCRGIYNRDGHPTEVAASVTDDALDAPNRAAHTSRVI